MPCGDPSRLGITTRRSATRSCSKVCIDGSTAWISFRASSAPRCAHQVIFPTRSTVELPQQGCAPHQLHQVQPGGEIHGEEGTRQTAAASATGRSYPSQESRKSPCSRDPRRQRRPRCAPSSAALAWDVRRVGLRNGRLPDGPLLRIRPVPTGRLPTALPPALRQMAASLPQAPSSGSPCRVIPSPCSEQALRAAKDPSLQHHERTGSWLGAD